MGFNFFLLGLFVVMLGGSNWLLFWLFVGLVRCVLFFFFMFWFVF